MSSDPIKGQPFNFQGLLECYLIPRAVAADKKLLPGARLLWGVIRQHSFRDGRCYASDETLSKLLAVSTRQVIRYMRMLQANGLLRTTQREGKTPIRELLWDSRFNGKIRKGVDMHVRGGGHPRQGGLTSASGLYKEEGSLNGSLKVKSGGVQKMPSPQGPAPRTEKPAAEWSEEDYIRRGRECGFPDYIIQQDIARMRRRLARDKATGMHKADELKAELEAAIRR